MTTHSSEEVSAIVNELVSYLTQDITDLYRKPWLRTATKSNLIRLGRPRIKDANGLKLYEKLVDKRLDEIWPRKANDLPQM